MTDIKTYEPLWGTWYVESLLGEGGFGKVYKVRREEYGRTYYSAVKIISIPHDEGEVRQMKSEGFDDASMHQFWYAFVTDIISEIDLMRRFRGASHIVSLEDHQIIEKEDDIGWDILIRMELLTSLSDHVMQTPLAEDDVVKMGIHMCRALELCARQNTLHRDIKPDNIFISLHDEYKLGDFGIARQLERTMSGLSKKGTHTYMAPEVFRGEEYGASVDTYSLGIVLYRFLNQNRTPFLPDHPQAIMPSHRDEAMQRRMRGERVPDLKGTSQELNAIVAKACAFNRHERFESPTEMREALEAVAANKKASETVRITANVKHIPVSQQGNMPPSLSDSRKGRKNKGWRIAVLGSGILAIVGVIVLIFVLSGLFNDQGPAQDLESVEPPKNEQDYAKDLKEGNTKSLVGYDFGNKADDKVENTGKKGQGGEVYLYKEEIFLLKDRANDDLHLFFSGEGNTFNALGCGKGDFFGIEIGVDTMIKFRAMFGEPSYSGWSLQGFLFAAYEFEKATMTIEFDEEKRASKIFYRMSDKNKKTVSESNTPTVESKNSILGKWARGSYIFDFWDSDAMPVTLKDPTGEAGWGLYFKDNDQYLEYRSGEILSDDGVVKKYLTIIYGSYSVNKTNTIRFSDMKVYSRQNIGGEIKEYWPEYADYELPFEISDEGNTFTFLNDYENRGLREFKKIN
ncbi:MAG: serine/threonine protein kinase [Peptococcaceae bacterium]|nr:serine/threonine protein kinase [Peptococcaceae bacterium]